jgi:hypothetical protein
MYICVIIRVHISTITKVLLLNYVMAIIQLLITLKIYIFINDLYLHHMCFILNDLKCYGNVISSSKNHFGSAKENE